jgi:hypothetical protein
MRTFSTGTYRRVCPRALCGVLFGAWAFWLSCGLAEASAADSVDVRIRVIDEAMRKPVGGTLVRFEARSRRLLGRSDLDGEVVFRSVPAGEYEVDITAPGYLDAHAHARVDPGADTTITVTLQRPLQLIGSITSRRDANVATVSRDSATSRLFPDFAELLNRLGEASVSLDRNGRLGSVSLAGKDASLSTVTFDGVDLSDPVARHAVDPDLVQSARANTSAATLDLFSLAATPWPQYLFNGTLGGYGSARTKASVQTTTGSAGWVAQYATDAQRSVLYGSRYRDSSGLDYVHQGEFKGDRCY